jgi:hypothetical protein
MSRQYFALLANPSSTFLQRLQPFHHLKVRDTLIRLYTATPLVHSQVGLHPDTNEPILANSSRFGPYLKHLSLTVTLPKGCGLLDVTLEQALAAVAAKETRMRARGRDPYEVRALFVGLLVFCLATGWWVLNVSSWGKFVVVHCMASCALHVGC